MSMFQNTEKQLAQISEFSFWTLVKFGLQRFRWWTLLAIGGFWLALVIIHVVVLSDPNRFLPSPSNQDQPADGIATANFVLVSLLFVGALSLSFDVKRTFTDIQKDIRKQPQQSQFENPLAIDAAENGISVRNTSGTIAERPRAVKMYSQVQEKVPVAEQQLVAQMEAEDRALAGLKGGFSNEQMMQEC